MTFDSIGCYIDCSAQSADELNSEVVAFAAGYGFALDDELNAILERIGTDDEQEDDSQALSDAADEAEEWLNDNTERPPFTYWSIEDNSLFLRVDVEGAQESDEVIGCADLPEFLLHVNDHGNATLYRVVLQEVWGVV